MCAAVADATFEETSTQYLKVIEGGALEQMTRGEVDMQVSTAKRYPRSLKKFKEDALTMATLDVETAEACFYVLNRGDSAIEGPGVRLAEIVASCWGNLRCESRIVAEDSRFITAQGTCWDMERNVLSRIEVRRRITDRNGNTFKDDMIGVTGNAAMAIAYRNAVFKVIPSAYTRAVYEEARKVAMGDSRTLDQRRQMALAYFAKAGVTVERVLAMLGKSGVEEIDVQCIGILAGTRTALQEGTTTIDDAFPVATLKPGVHNFGFKKSEPAPTPAAAADKAAEAPAAQQATPPVDEKPAEQPAAEPKAKRAAKPKETPPAAVSTDPLLAFALEVSAAKTEDELVEMFRKTSQFPPAYIPKARELVTKRQDEVMRASGEPPHDENGVVTEETEAGARG